MFRKTDPFRWMLSVIIIACLGLFLGCGTGGLGETAATGGGTGGGTETGGIAASFKVTASPISVKSGDVETSTITAMALDSSNAAIKDLVVIFSASGGKISSNSKITDENGNAKITFSSGTIDPSNRVVTITAYVHKGTANELSSRIPVTIVGSTLTMYASKTSIKEDGSDFAELTLTAMNAKGEGINDTPITLSVSGTGRVTLSTYSDNTNSSGVLKVTVTGSNAGSVTVTATGLGATATQSFTISSAAQIFGFRNIDNPTSLATDEDLDLSVYAPTGVTRVRFATTFGTLDDNGSPVQVLERNVTAGAINTFSDIFSSARAGIATIEVSDVSNPQTTDTLSVIISAPAAAAATLTLDPSESSLPVSFGDVKNTITLTAKVKSILGDPVKDAAVHFSINPPTTGGGETVYPVISFTNSSGIATSTFTSGSLGSDALGVAVQAQIVGTTVTSTVHVIIRAKPGSVVIGRDTKLVVGDAIYQLPMVVMVTNANGTGVDKAVVSLSAWPDSYSTGVWYDTNPDPDTDKFAPYISGTFANEDINENLSYDEGENVNRNFDSNGKPVLDPPNSAAGSVPATVTTDSDGKAQFYLTYRKESSVWINTRVRATVQVEGTENTTSVTFTLPAEKSEAEAGLLYNSQYPLRIAYQHGTGTHGYQLPVFNGDLASTYVSTSSSGYVSIPVSSGVATYNFNSAAPVGTYSDIIIMTNSLGGVYASVPITIVIY